MNYLYTLIALQILDALTTYWIIRRGGHEKNPILIWFAEQLKSITNAKWAWLVLSKLAVAGIALWLFQVAPEILQFAICVFYAAIVVWNFSVLEAQKRVS